MAFRLVGQERKKIVVDSSETLFRCLRKQAATKIMFSREHGSLKKKRGEKREKKSIPSICYMNAKALKVYVVFQRDEGKTTYCAVYF